MIIFLYVTILLTIFQLIRMHDSELTYCSLTNQEWDESFFKSNLPTKVYPNDILPKYWKGELSPKMGWKLLRPIDFKRATTLQGNLNEYKSLFLKAQRNEDILIVTLGGSVTRGNDCGKRSELECSWSGRLEVMLKAYGANSVKVVNAAIGGSDISIGYVHIISKIWEAMSNSHQIPDLFILGYTINDATYFRGDITSHHIESSYEDAIRAIYSFYPKPMVIITTEFAHHPRLNMNVTNPNALAAHNLKIEGYIHNVANYYGISIVSYTASLFQKHLKHCKLVATENININNANNYDCTNSPFFYSKGEHYQAGIHQTKN